ncbi:MAG: diguanylate cyclase (GGDEF)-like protein/PAS domain S-box-containing protein [Sulfurimonas sp.]|jgi:diguanylate cyclase (GGDEF)-like protein/PAS domain S-box-containing protein
MNKYLLSLIITILTFILLTIIIFFSKYTFSESEKIAFAVIFSIVVGFVFELQRNNRRQIDRLLKAAKISRVGFWVLDLTNNTLFWSDEIYNMFDIKDKECKPSYDKFLNIIHPDDRDAVNESYTKSLDTKEDYIIEHRLIMDDGRIKWVTERCETEFDKNGKPLVSVGIVTDITKEKLYLQQITELSYIDNLTKLHNRKCYNERIGELLSLKKRSKTPFSMLIYDIDNFKYINDNYGHKVGDEVLIKMSKLVESLIRKSDYLFRVGGEEFVLLLTQTNLKDAKNSALKICKSVEESLLNITEKSITISMGLSEATDSDTEDTIFKRVDKLLYKSKQSGKNKVSYNEK